MKVTEILDVGNDVLLVKGEDDEGNEISAQGWVSALNHHFDEDAYEEKNFEDHGIEGLHLKEDAEARSLDDFETHDYALGLLLSQNFELNPINPQPVAFKSPEDVLD